jgi:hypothetical protein
MSDGTDKEKEGDPLVEYRAPPGWWAEIEDRFWASVDKSNLDGCWPWTARCHRNQPRFAVSRQEKQNARSCAFMLAHSLRALPPGTCAVSVCGAPQCVRPDHLVVRPVREIRAANGRSNSGAKNGRAKLTEDDVRAIRALFPTPPGGGPRPKGELTHVEVAARYGIHHTMVASIVRRKSWRHI